MSPIRPLHVEVGVMAPWVVRMLTQARRNDPVRLSVGRVNGSDWRKPGVLRLERASLVSPAVSVLAHPATHCPASEALGRSEAAWTAPDGRFEPWRLRAAPLPALHWGRPDPQRGWALVARTALRHREAIVAQAEALGLQLHVMGAAPRWRGTGAVCWGTGPRGLASLLGRVDVVFAPPGPLAWDALRAGARVIDPSPPGTSHARLAGHRLANVVPPALVGDAAFWRALMGDAREPETPRAPWGTRAWFEAAQARLGKASPSQRNRVERTKRKLMKLRRDPHAFFADSRYVPFVTRD